MTVLTRSIQRELCLLLAAAVVALGWCGIANAGDLNKCVKDGKTTYQSEPCDGAATGARLKSGTRASSMAGCYTAPGFDGGLRVTRAGTDGYSLDLGVDKTTKSVPMKTATAEELRQVGDAFHLALYEGVSMKWDKDTPNQKPIGLYKGRDAGGREFIFAFFFIGNAEATVVPCK